MNPFQTWTQADADAYNRKATSRIIESQRNTPVESEPDLHDDILDFCRERGWIAVHSRMDRKTTQAVGIADFIIAAAQGRVFWIEVKSKSGKLSVAQKGFAMQLDKLGHECFLVRSMDDFREVVK